MVDIVKEFRMGELFCGPGGLALGATNLCHAEISTSFPSAGSDNLSIHSLLFPRFFWLYSCKMSNYLLPFGHHVQTQIIFFALTFGQFVQTQKYRCFSLSCLDIMSKHTIFVPFFINFNVYLQHIKCTFFLFFYALQDTHPVSTRMHIQGLSLDVLARENSLEPFLLRRTYNLVPRDCNHRQAKITI